MPYPKWLEMRTQKSKDFVTLEDAEKDRDHLLPHHNERNDSGSDLNSRQNQNGSLFTRVVINLLVVLIALAVMIILLLLQIFMQDSKCYGKFENGFDTDLVAAKSQIELEKVMFTGGIHFNPDGSVYIKDIPGPKYVGPPSPEIDKAWDELLYGQIVNLPESQVPDVKDRTFFRPEYQAYETGLDAVHQLHCINQIRKAYAPEYYGALDKSPHGTKIHIGSSSSIDIFCASIGGDRLYTELTFGIQKDHCLDYLRQSIQCSADMTPVVLYYEPAINMSLLRMQVRETKALIKMDTEVMDMEVISRNFFLSRRLDYGKS
ncbi:hypothetical protein N7517_009198 [Penicillium concentricum]|uniref:Uncharacterized protein n=1 Tax=Penicillium concentricum TaxID=293559 RepID=A0A9W9RGR9_9EURO|nr:uncharacterized protein N7517_009198 [Penicillium concentricum]KAJ5360007.1 hypothetical protein N7517_009198 [Penicillium concentricum]